MSLERLKEIRVAEEESGKIVQKAENKAQKLLADARKQSDEIIKKAESDGHNEAKSIQTKTEEDTEKEISQLEKDASLRKKKLREAKKGKLEDSTSLILKLVAE